MVHVLSCNNVRHLKTVQVDVAQHQQAHNKQHDKTIITSPWTATDTGNKQQH